MLNQISLEIRKSLQFSKEDKIIFNNKLIEINQNNFSPILKPSFNSDNKIIAFIDGGQAEIISAGNFCLSFIRVFAQVFQNNKKIDYYKHEFYLFTKAKYLENDLFYESKIYLVTKKDISEKLVDEKDLFISSNDQTIKSGLERAPISKITNMARRFAELALAKKLSVQKAIDNQVIENTNPLNLKPIDFIFLDGTLDKTFKNEEKYLNLSEHVCALAKTSCLFTVAGDNPLVLLNRIGLEGCWSYYVEGQTYFVKLHNRAKHVFRFTGNKNALSWLIDNSKDAIFLGYPYGLILADQLARVSNTEKSSFKTKFLLREENKEILDYLSTSNAHDILDSLG